MFATAQSKLSLGLGIFLGFGGVTGNGREGLGLEVLIVGFGIVVI